MPAPAAVYVVAVIGGVAAAIAFKEFVYEPHLAPKVERWKEEFKARREAHRARRQGAIAVSVASPSTADKKAFAASGKYSDDEDDDEHQYRSSHELEKLVSKEVHEWRNTVGRSQSGLRHRKNLSTGGVGASSALDESNIAIPIAPMSPTHVLFDSSLPSTPTSIAASSPSPSPPPLSFTNPRSPSRSPVPASPPAITARSPTPPQVLGDSGFLVPRAARSSTDDLEFLSASAGSPFVQPSELSSHPGDMEFVTASTAVSENGSSISLADSTFDEIGEGSEVSSWASVRR